MPFALAGPQDKTVFQSSPKSYWYAISNDGSMDCRCLAGTPMQNLAHSASFHSCPETKHPNGRRQSCRLTKSVGVKLLDTISLLGSERREFLAARPLRKATAILLQEFL